MNDYTFPEGAPTITAQDKRALKHADSWVWRTYKGEHALEAYLPGHSSPTGFDQRHVIRCVGSLIRYDSHAGTSGTGAIEQYYAFHSDYWRDELRTFLADLAVGSVIGLKWIMGNNNENMRDIGWRRDELHVTVTSPKGRSRTYLIAAETGPVNSASMVQVKR